MNLPSERSSAPGPRFTVAQHPIGTWRPPRVYVITWCGEIEQLWGTLLTFRTLRVGYPTAAVTVIDNASLEEARPAIERAAKDAGCEYVQRTTRAPHGAILGDVLARVDEPIVFVDPDVIFWESCEGWTFDRALIAGRLIPMREGRPGFFVLPRLHTSHLWITHPPLVREALLAQEHCFFPMSREFISYAFQQHVFKLGGPWLFVDTGAALYSYLANFAYAFGPRELDAYDHIWSGTHPRVHNESSHPAVLARRTVHEIARDGDYRSLRGVWRAQEQRFQAEARDFAMLAAAGAFAMPPPLACPENEG